MSDWTQITVTKPTPPRYSKLGQVRGAYGKRGMGKPWTDAERKRIVHEVKHQLCVDHVHVDGYRERVCVLRGQSSQQVIEEVLELSKGEPPQRTGVWMLLS